MDNAKIMDKLKLEIIKKVLMLDTLEEVKNLCDNVSEAVSREVDLDDQEQEEFQKWKSNQANA